MRLGGCLIRSRQLRALDSCIVIAACLLILTTCQASLAQETPADPASATNPTRKSLSELPIPDRKDQPANPSTQYQLDTDKRYFLDVKDDAPIVSGDKNPGELLAYNEVLLHARRIPQVELEEHADSQVLYRDLLMDNRKSWQFKLIQMEGRLRRLRKLDVKPNKELEEKGLTHLYEAWVFPLKSDEPFVVITTEIPKGIEPALNYEPSIRVLMTGYFFKVIHYESAEESKTDPERNRWRRVPLLIGHSFSLKEPAASRSIFEQIEDILPILIGSTVGIILLLLVLRWWLRRGDQIHRDERSARTSRNPFES